MMMTDDDDDNNNDDGDDAADDDVYEFLTRVAVHASQQFGIFGTHSLPLTNHLQVEILRLFRRHQGGDVLVH